MYVILKEKIRKLGDLGDKVKVKPGYARNYLVPRKAEFATEENIIKFEARRAELEKAAKVVLDAAAARAKELEGLVLQITAKAGEAGKLFGSIGPREIFEALKAKDFKIAKNEIMLSGSIRNTGEYEVSIHLHTDVEAIIKVNVVAL